MNRIKGIVVLILAAVISGCGPSVVVQNNTKFAIRVVITTPDGSEVVSPTPGESSTVDAAEGSYRATAIPDADWIEWAKLTRKVLNDQLANSDNLTGPQLLEVIRRLKDIAARMQQFESAAGVGASCGGALSSDADGLVTVSQAANGTLVVSCK